MMRICLLLLLSFCFVCKVCAQVTGDIAVGGDVDKFYPVVFTDAGWWNNTATELEIGRSQVHRDSSWWGSVIAKFRYHVTTWGNGSSFIDADIREYALDAARSKLVAGWRDASISNNESNIIIWLRGNTTYSYKANYIVNPLVYDGVQHSLPFQEINGPAHTFKTAVDSYVNQYGMSYNNTMYVNGNGVNYYAGSVGIGTTTTGAYKLAVEGAIGARKVKVTQAEGWPDFVFEEGYELPALREVEKYVKEHKHLPGVPAAEEVEKEGVDLGEMNKRLLQKVEELTLYMIELHEQNQDLKAEVEVLKRKMQN